MRFLEIIRSLCQASKPRQSKAPEDSLQGQVYLAGYPVPSDWVSFSQVKGAARYEPGRAIFGCDAFVYHDAGWLVVQQYGDHWLPGAKGIIWVYGATNALIHFNHDMSLRDRGGKEITQVTLKYEEVWK